MNNPEPIWSLTQPTLRISLQQVEVAVLRVLRHDKRAPAVLSAAFGFEWPTTPNTMTGHAVRVAWLAPGVWAIFGSPRRVADEITAACAGSVHHFSDASAGRNLWSVSGAASRDLLATGCSLDLHDRVFRSEQCAQTFFAEVPALVMRPDASDTFWILTDVSFETHMQGWFANTMKYMSVGAPS